MTQDNISQLETHRCALTGHCYRMLGSIVDAEDAVQETMIRAWRGIERFDGRSSLRTWLYRIATNVCLDELAARSRRARPMEDGPAGSTDGVLAQHPRSHWLEPVADARALPADADPSELAILRQSIRLAFVAALQHLPPKQRAVLLLIDVLGWSAAEAAESLDVSEASVNSALQRARATVATRSASKPSAINEPQTRLLDRYVDAFHRYDVDALVSLLHEDVAFCMPPYSLWLQGPDAVRAWLIGKGAGCRGSRLIPVAACGSPAFAQYHPSPGGDYKPWALVVLELAGDRIAGWNSFLDTETLFPRFDLPASLLK
jgi:RNA polymerase sigma-70 factor, ECF subfamily